MRLSSRCEVESTDDGGSQGEPRWVVCAGEIYNFNGSSQHR